MVSSRHGGQDRISTKSRLASELILLGNILLRARERSGMKQMDVAAKLEKPASYLSKIESGTRRVDVIELVQIARAMNTDPAEIMRELEQELGR